MSTSNDPLHRNNLFSMKDRVALVTGGGSGIGLMIAQAFASNGAKVYIVGRTKEKLETAAQAHGQKYEGQIIPIVADITKKEEISRLYDEISSKEKCLCVLVNNVGISGGTFETSAKSATELKQNLFDNKDATFDDWVDTYKFVVPHLYFMSTAFLPLLEHSTDRHQGWSGTIINITSISGMVKTFQHHAAYNSAKAGAIHLSRMLANEIADNGIKVRVNSLAPGVFPSEMTTDGSDEQQKSHIPKEKYEDKVPAKRSGKDEDMASAALFLATNQYLNGVNLQVDGGYTLAAGL